MSAVRRFGHRIRSALSSAVRGASTTPAISSVLTTYPVLLPLTVIYEKLSTMSNKYDVYRGFTEIDPELYGAISFMARQVKQSYKGIGVAFGKELDEKEKELLQIVTQFERKWDLPGLFFSVAFHMIRDGDDIYAVKIEDKVGLVGLRPLPIPYVTIVAREEQIGKSDAQIFESNICVLNEAGTTLTPNETEQMLKFQKNEFVIFAMSNRAEIILDTMGRFTFGIWSLSPIESLKSRLYWKLAVLINDILVRQKIIPREHHKLDLSAFDPAMFAGDTMEERIQAAKTAAVAFLDDYKSRAAAPLKEVDKAYITGKDTDISFLEPKTVAYIDPNPLLDQINVSIIAATGAPESSLLGRGRGTYATELVIASYTSAAAEALANIIKTQVLSIVKRSIQAQYPGKYTSVDLDKIDIRIRSLIGLEKGEAARRTAIMDATGVATFEELRNEAGLERVLTEEEKQQILGRRMGKQGRQIAKRTQKDIEADFRRREQEPEPATPESAHQRKQT